MRPEELDGESPARVRQLLAVELRRSAEELEKSRAGREEPVTIAVAPGVTVVAPGPRVEPPLRNALSAVGEGQLHIGTYEGYVALQVAADLELAVLAIEEELDRVDRLRARVLHLPFLNATDLRPLLDPAEDDTIRPHDDPDPARRAARRILQTLVHKGKWGGFHTEFTHLARGFHGNDQRLAGEVGEALVAAGLLLEKPSVGQRHVYLNPRRKGDIERLIEEGRVPDDLKLGR